MSGRGRRGNNRYYQGNANRPGNFQRNANQSGGTWKQMGNQSNVDESAVNDSQQDIAVKDEQQSFVENNAANDNGDTAEVDQDISGNTDGDQDMTNTEEQNGDDKSISELIGANGKLPFSKIFKSRKKPSVRAKEKKLRVNRHLRKAIFPKNALMALNELKGLTVSEFSFNTSETGGFTAVVSVNGKQHSGKGSSKMAAKNSACESALRDFVIAKMIQKPRQTKRHKNSISGDQEMESMDDTQSIAESQKSLPTDEGDDIPMVNLASFALFKLFSEWEREGFVVPEMHPHDFDANAGAAPAEAPAEPKPPTIRSELPKNWEQMHPATLLCMMRPGITYKDLGSTGEKTTIQHRLGVVVDGKEFVGSGRSKKLARKNVAIVVCNELFGTNFETEES